MSRLTENLLWGSVGAGLGYLLTRRYLEAEYQARLDGQLENADEFYRLKYEKKLREERQKDLEESVETIETLVKESPVVEEPEDAPEQSVDSIIADADLTNTLTNYRGMFKGESAPSEHVEVTRTVTPVPEQSATEPVEVAQSQKPSAKLPVIITQEAFMEEQMGFKQLQQTYYAGDDVLATETNRVVSDGVRLSNLGEEVLEKLKMGLDGNAEVIYVRNKELSVEYEIFRDPRMYMEAVGPIGSVE